MKQIRIFKNGNEFLLVEAVNNFIKDCKGKIEDIQYSSAGSIFGTQYSVMIVIEDEK